MDSLPGVGEAIAALCAEAEAAVAGARVAVSLADVEGGRRWSREGERPVVAASLIKLPILAAAYEAAAEGDLSLAEPVAWAAEDQVLGCGVLRELSPGGSLPLRDLLALMMVVSDNAATNLVLARVGIGRVNRLCDRLGLRGTRLLRPLMVVPAGAGTTNTVTADDMAVLLERLALGRVVSWDASRRMIELLKRQRVRDGLPARLPQREEPPLGSLPLWEVANKTGGIRGFQHDAGLLFLPGRCFALAVLTQGLAAPAAKSTIARIARAVYDRASGGDPA